MPQWNPPGWHSKTSADRVNDFVAWERETIQPKYGITEGVEYTHTIGVAELYDYEWFFGGFPFTVRDQTARSLGVASGTEGGLLPPPELRHVEYPVLRPARVPQRLDGRVPRVRRVPPRNRAGLSHLPTASRGRRAGSSRTGSRRRTIQIRRNRQTYPRPWVVHDARGCPPWTA